MENMQKIATSHSPAISFDSETGVLIIEGHSIPENPINLFQPLMEEVVKYCEKPAAKTLVELRFDYCNTSSVKWIFHILEKFERIYVYDKQVVQINFYYSDENTLEMGKYLQINLAIPIDLINVQQ